MKFHPAGHAFFDGLTSLPEFVESPIEVRLLSHSEEKVSSQCIVVEDSLEPSEVVAHVTQHGHRHVVQKNGSRFQYCLTSTARLMLNPNQYFERDFCFYSQKVLSKLQITFAGKVDKLKVKSQIHQFAHQAGGLAVSLCADAIFEELYMNATIDAPKEAVKKGQSASVASPEIFLCQTEDWLQISCTDFHGSLNVQTFLNRLHEVYEEGAGQVINMSESTGAGLGCMILFENSACLILGVESGRQTKVSCFVPLKLNNRQRTQMKKSLHWFEL